MKNSLLSEMCVCFHRRHSKIQIVIGSVFEMRRHDHYFVLLVSNVNVKQLGNILLCGCIFDITWIVFSSKKEVDYEMLSRTGIGVVFWAKVNFLCRV